DHLEAPVDRDLVAVDHERANALALDRLEGGQGRALAPEERVASARLRVLVLVDGDVGRVEALDRAEGVARPDGRGERPIGVLAWHVTVLRSVYTDFRSASQTRGLTALAVLHRALVFLRRGAGLERAQVAPLAGLRVRLAGVEPIAAVRELADHRP